MGNIQWTELFSSSQNVITSLFFFLTVYHNILLFSHPYFN